MGYNDEFSGQIVVDLETAPLDDAADYLDLDTIDAPANYKDPEKIKAYCEEKRAEKLGRCALDPDLCRIVAIGTWTAQHELQAVLAKDGDEEAFALSTLWDAIGQRQIVGFNVVSFDALVLLRRSLYLGVMPIPLRVERFRHPQIVDLLQELTYHGLLPMHKLDFYCRRLKLDIPKDETNGAMVPELVAAGKWDEVAWHVQADTMKTKALAERLGHL